MNKLIERLAINGHGASFWLLLMALGISLEGTALFYQYVLDEPPCVLCIHVRIWLALLILFAFAGLLLRGSRMACILIHASNLVISAILLERSWQLLGNERGFIIGTCGFDLGLPPWLALDRWLPSVFEVQTTCGYTPELIFGITMAEALLLLSGILLITSLSFLIASLLHPEQ